MTQPAPHDLLSMTVEELQALLNSLGHPAYRAAQLFEWLHRRGWGPDTGPSFAAMNNLPQALRTQLAQVGYITAYRTARQQHAQDGTVKFLYEVGGDPTAAQRGSGAGVPPAQRRGDGGSTPIQIESVLMHYAHGLSVCVSTQAGCRMGCHFCASAQGGLVRNLSAGEICAQIYACEAGGPRIASVVLMGCGEPLDNFDAVIRFVHLISHPKGMGLGVRHITLSTCGLVPQIRALADLQLQLTLAVSLHGPTDDVRRQFMPIANTYPMAQLLDACRHYAAKTRRRITFEYALAAGVNDAPAQAAQLAKQLRGLLCHVNLIPINPAAGPFSPSPRNVVNAFAESLTQRGIPTTIRRSLGQDIAAACGQLRAHATPDK